MKRKKDESSIDLTPMLDVVFILLIFFVVTASFLKESALDMQGQNPDNDPPPPSNDMPENALIQINNQDQVFLNRERIELTAVRARIASIRAENPEAAVIVQPSPSSKANVLVSVMDASRAAGAYTIQVMEGSN